MSSFEDEGFEDVVNLGMIRTSGFRLPPEAAASSRAAWSGPPGSGTLPDIDLCDKVDCT